MRQRLIRGRRGWEAIPVAAVAATVLIALAGCSAQSNDDLGVPEKNRLNWSMPLDSYQLPATGLQEYAQNLLAKPCMEKAGYDWDVPYQDIHAGPGASYTDYGRRLFNVKLAKEFGYHSAPRNNPTDPAWEQFTESMQGISTAESDQFDECLTVANKQLRPLSAKAQVAASFANAALASAEQDPDVIKAASAWHECMLSTGIADLPADPSQMPSPALIDRFQLADHTSAATADEKAVATQDAQCRESSGYDQKAYDAEWDQQLKLLRDNADNLERVRGEIKAEQERVLKVIAENAPAAS